MKHALSREASGIEEITNSDGQLNAHTNNNVHTENSLYKNALSKLGPGSLIETSNLTFSKKHLPQIDHSKLKKLN